MNLINSIINVLLLIGEFSPLALPLIAFFLGLSNIIPALLVDFAFINPFIKNTLYTLGLQSKRPICPTLNRFGCAGMPSGHTEVNWIFLIYLIIRYLETNNSTGLIPIFLLTLITMWQRWAEGKHSLIQILGGAFTGSLFGYLLYQLLNP